MKKTLITITALIGLSIGAGTPSPVTPVGDQFVTQSPVKWYSAGNTLSFAGGATDTVSGWVAMGVGGLKPGTVYSLWYYGKCTDSTSSTLKLGVESRYCYSSQDSSGCDTVPTIAGSHRIYGNLNINDTLTLQNLHGDVRGGTSHDFYVPHGNSFRFRTMGSAVNSGKTCVYGGMIVRGQ